MRSFCRGGSLLPSAMIAANRSVSESALIISTRPRAPGLRLNANLSVQYHPVAVAPPYVETAGRACGPSGAGGPCTCRDHRKISPSESNQIAYFAFFTCAFGDEQRSGLCWTVMDPSNFISVRDAAAIVGCTENTLRVRARRRKMTIARFGTGFHVLLRRDEVEQMLRRPPKQGRPPGIHTPRRRFAPATDTTTAMSLGATV
jgi:hypothetical protein